MTKPEVGASASVPLVELLRAGAATGARAVELQPGGTETSLADVWDRAGRASTWLSEHVAASGRVGATLGNSLDGLALTIGSWLADVDFVSLPQAPRRTPDDAYARRLVDLADAAGVELIVDAPPVVSAVWGRPTATQAEILAGGRGRRSGGTGCLIQYSSGSTGAPKGVVLTQDALAANALALVNRLQHTHPRLVSWLPLSHDMGLMCLLSTWSAFDACGGADGLIGLMTPHGFVTSPSSWLRNMTQWRGTLSAAPNAALDVVARSDRAFAGAQLESWQACVVGAEPISLTTLERFTARVVEARGRSTVACPAYGMAEVACGVTAVDVGEPFRAIRVGSGADIVSVGRPLQGMDLRIVDDSDEAYEPGFGVIEVRGPSMMRGYVGGADQQKGWLRTSDVGALVDGELHVVGRADDVLTIAGQKLHPFELEEAVGRAVGLSAAPMALVAPAGELTLVAERAVLRSARCDIAGLMSAARSATVARAGVAVDRCVVVANGAIPRTTSGKPRRRELARLVSAAELDILSERA